MRADAGRRPTAFSCARYYSSRGFPARFGRRAARVQSSAASPETIEVDPSAPSHPFPHFWEQMFGSGRAILSLRDNYRQDLCEAKQATGF